MALYDGFFDFSSEVLEETGKYDREYNAADFTGYFGAFIGDGVCVYQNPDSMRVSIESGRALVAPGYLFIQGYWLANQAEPGEENYWGYSVDLPASGEYAVVARLDLARSLIEITTLPKADSYPDCLVLALVDAANGTVEDTRADPDLCGIVDALGDLAAKVEYAVNYIDNEIEDRFQEAEEEIAAQNALLDAKIAEVAAEVEKITPPPVGSIKFTASQDVGPEWLRCDGSFVNENDYPELVAALGKLTPSGDKFNLISAGQVGPQISNGVIYNGRMWVYSYSTKKLYGVDLEGEQAVKEISVTSEDSGFLETNVPTSSVPIALSIVESKTGGSPHAFLAQIKGNGTIDSSSTIENLKSYIWIYGSEFDEEANSINLSVPFTTIAAVNNSKFTRNNCTPYVISELEGTKEIFYALVGFGNYDITRLYWEKGENLAKTDKLNSNDYVKEAYYKDQQKIAYSKKANNEAVFVNSCSNQAGALPVTYNTNVISINTGIFERGSNNAQNINVKGIVTVPNALTVTGENQLIFEMTTESMLVISLKEVALPLKVDMGLSLPNSSRIFTDAAAYLWGKDIYMVFVGTGLIFSRTLEDGSFGYLDTTSVLGTITQFGYLDYSQDENTLYILGQDTNNQVKLAKMVLNTLYDYANDGAWLPMIASDGVPAYIKAKDEDNGGGVITDPVDMSVTVTVDDTFNTYCDVIFNDGVLISGTFTRTVSASGTFTVGIRVKASRHDAGTSHFYLKMNGTTVATIDVSAYTEIGTEQTAAFSSADFVANGITLNGTETA